MSKKKLPPQSSKVEVVGKSGSQKENTHHAATPTATAPMAETQYVSLVAVFKDLPLPQDDDDLCDFITRVVAMGVPPTAVGSIAYLLAGRFEKQQGRKINWEALCAIDSKTLRLRKDLLQVLLTAALSASGATDDENDQEGDDCVPTTPATDEEEETVIVSPPRTRPNRKPRGMGSDPVQAAELTVTAEYPAAVRKPNRRVTSSKRVHWAAAMSVEAPDREGTGEGAAHGCRPHHNTR